VSASRWIRLDTTWSQSEWVAALDPEARLAWVELLCHVATNGSGGRCERPDIEEWGPRVGVDCESVREMEAAALEAKALAVARGCWRVASWKRYQPPPAYNSGWRRVRADILARDDGACAYCGAPADHVDHVIPRHQGGTDDPANLVAACMPCNTSKGPRTPEEWLG
jgi:hypothetical protein